MPMKRLGGAQRGVQSDACSQYKQLATTRVTTSWRATVLYSRYLATHVAGYLGIRRDELAKRSRANLLQHNFKLNLESNDLNKRSTVL